MSDRRRAVPGEIQFEPDRGFAYLHRLKVIGVFAPIVGIVVLEALRIVFEAVVQGEGLGHSASEQIIPAVVTVAGVVVFALIIFSFIERVQRELVRQNRELVAVNAVSTAVQGELTVDEVIDAVIESVTASTGATDVSVTVFDEETGLAEDGGTVHHAALEPHPASSGAHPLHLVDIPLSTSSRIVGRLRLSLPDGAGDPDLLAATTLQNIGHQLGSSIQTAQLFADLQRRQREGHALYDILVQISHQGVLADTLAMIVDHARNRLGADEAVACLNEPSAHLVEVTDAGPAAVTVTGACVSSAAAGGRHSCCGDRSCSFRSATEFPEHASAVIASRDEVLGDLWVGRREGRPFPGRDREFLATLSDLASIAITNARMRESEQLTAIRGERERIAREMHDSLAQVLGVTQLRLRALLGNHDILQANGIATELSELADIAGDAYRDVREAILGLRESSRTDRGLVESLAAYLEKYERQTGIETSLEAEPGDMLTLPPRSEIQVIRVIQEALTNVRKHAGARSVAVRITETPGRVTFVVEDDGSGFDPKRAAAGQDTFGLQSMRERVALVGGALSVEAAPGQGTRVVASVPASYQPASV
jgi:nitrate/nitrite-specific signal transduction histidine kinase